MACNRESFRLLYSKYVDAGRVIIFSRYGSSRSKTLERLKWHTLPRVLLLNCLKYLHKAIFNECSFNKTSELFKKITPGHQTRSKTKNNYSSVQLYNNRCKKCIHYWGPKIWNYIPQNLKEMKNYNLFLNAINNFVSQLPNEEVDDLIS